MNHGGWVDSEPHNLIGNPFLPRYFIFTAHPMSHGGAG